MIDSAIAIVLWAIGLLWPVDATPFAHWVHYIEATIGLNVVSSFYRRLADNNIGWIVEYVALKRRWILRNCDYERSLDIRLRLIRRLHVRASMRSRDMFTTFSFLTSLLGLSLLYVEANHPELPLSSWQQFVMAMLLFVPIPCAFFFGFCLHLWTGLLSTVLLRRFYRSAFSDRAAARLHLWAVEIDRMAGRLAHPRRAQSSQVPIQTQVVGPVGSNVRLIVGPWFAVLRDADEIIVADGSASAPITLLLPVSPSMGKKLEIRKGPNPDPLCCVVIEGNGNNIAGRSQIVMSFANQTAILEFTGSHWTIS